MLRPSEAARSAEAGGMMAGGGLRLKGKFVAKKLLTCSRIQYIAGSGLPTPRPPDVRYGLPGLRSLDAACAPASMPPLVSNAGVQGMGSPEPPLLVG